MGLDIVWLDPADTTSSGVSRSDGSWHFGRALTEAIQKLGGVEASASLGVVFTVFFALGLLLMRLVADESHLDADCVLYGAVETAYVGLGVPQAAIVSGGMLIVNLLLTAFFYKELRVSSFDHEFATSIGVHSRVMHYALMTITAATVVAAFESVGTILVIAMLIVPPATAHLLTDRLWKMIAASILIAARPWLGHAAAITLPGIIFRRLGFDSVHSASTAGMIAVVSGMLFLLAALFGPNYGLVARWWTRSRLAFRIASEDLLGLLYRRQEYPDTISAAGATAAVPRVLFHWLATRWLAWRGEIEIGRGGISLTDRGKSRAALLVRSHRLWESYMAKHFALQDDHLHEAAALVEHYLTPEIREAIASELAGPGQDPHGRQIPDE